MKALNAVLRKYAVLALVLSLLLPSAAFAKPLNPAKVQDLVVKHGAGSWVCVEEHNGVALVGRITSIGDQSFGMQLENYPEITPVMYDDVTRIRFGISHGAMFAIIGATLGSAVIATVVMHHEFEQSKAQLPPMPTLPVVP